MLQLIQREKTYSTWLSRRNGKPRISQKHSSDLVCSILLNTILVKYFISLRLLKIEFFSGTIFVAWLSDTSAYVSLNQREKFIEVNKNLKKFKNCKVQKYKDFQQILEEERKAGSNRTVDNGQKKSSLWRKCFCTFFALSLALLISLLCFFFFFWDQISKDNFQSFFDTSRDNFYSFFDTQSTDDTGAYSDLFQKATNVLNDAKDKLYFASDPDPDETTDESTGVISDLYQKVLNVPTVMKDYFESAAIGDYFNNFFL